MESIIRQMEAEEAPIVLKIGRRAFTGFESILVSRPRKALVAVIDGKIVGAVLYKLMQAGSKRIGYIEYAFVDPDYHNQGIGGRLYKASIEYLWKQGCDALTAIVKDDNVGSWGLFLKNGFFRASLTDIFRQFGADGVLRQYFGTPLCFGMGMEYYIALRDKCCPSGKGGNVKQITSYLLANLLLFLIILFRMTDNMLSFLIVYITFLAGGILAGYIGTLFSRRKWHFRLNNGGGFICALINLAGVCPMIGNWYPEHYENSDRFRRDMGVTALIGWIFVLSLTLLPISGISQNIIFNYFGQIGSIFLVLRILVFYPFESFGGKRVYQWQKGIYLLMVALSIAALAGLFLA